MPSLLFYLSDRTGVSANCSSNTQEVVKEGFLGSFEPTLLPPVQTRQQNGRTANSWHRNGTIQLEESSNLVGHEYGRRSFIWLFVGPGRTQVGATIASKAPWPTWAIISQIQPHAERNHQGLKNSIISPGREVGNSEGSIECRERWGGMLSIIIVWRPEPCFAGSRRD